MSDFVHLHCHTEYSLLDGATRIGELCARVRDLGMTACAITDHGSMFGAAFFAKECGAAGIRPVFGCEVYTCADRFDKTPEARRRNHLILLARNMEGYHNLVKVVTRGYTEGFYYKPRVDRELLSRHREGLVCLSACLAGEIPRAIAAGDMDTARRVAAEYAELYPGAFYLEIQSNGLKEQAALNLKLVELAGEMGLPLVATNDCHYLNADDADAHEVLLCIQKGTTMDDPKRMRFETRELYVKSQEEMEAGFPELPAEVVREAMAASVRIAESCDVEMEFGKHHFPAYPLPEGATADDELRRLAEEGLERRLERNPALDADAYRERLRHELDVICDMGFPGYFLIVQEFINWAKDRGIPVGPGRGSAAGSLVAWALRITNLDPIPYHLLFERFLNSERVSLPDIDVDFCERRRGEVIAHMVERYGAGNVAQITTFGSMKARSAVKDVGRALGMSVGETNRIAALVPNDLKMTLKRAMEQEKELERLHREDPQVRRLLDTAMRLEGLARHASVHAAGLVVSPRPMEEFLPLYCGKNGEAITQFDGPMTEAAGLVKFDFLGLRTMTLIQDTLDNIRLQGVEPPDLDTLPLDDRRAYDLYSRGDTDGVFQVESSGMRDYLRKLRPSCFEDIVAMLALYRPGPLGSGMVDEFIRRKHGQVPVVYPHPSLENCLRDTYGVIVYQEQVMQISQIIARYTLGGADLLRRAMGKKKAEVMARERGTFVQGAAGNGVDQEKADEIFDLMEKFAAYGFNKSHSAAYALVSYHTAWLKAHHPGEFMAALMTSEIGNQEKLLKYVSRCKDMGIAVERPSVNESRREFSVRDGRLIFGLGGIRNVGDEAIREIVAAREKDGPFLSLLDLCRRGGAARLTRRVLESLIKGGACDCLGATRAAMLALLDRVVEEAKRLQKAAEAGPGLLGVIPMPKQEPRRGVGIASQEEAMPEMDESLRLEMEKEALGFFLSGHPLQPYERAARRCGMTTLEDARDALPGAEIRCAVLVAGCKEIATRKGDRMAFVEVEDLTGHAEVTFFPRDYAEARALLAGDGPLCLAARVEGRDMDDDDPDAPRGLKLMGVRVADLEEACYAAVPEVVVEAPEDRLHEEAMLELRSLLLNHAGDVPVLVEASLEGRRVGIRVSAEYGVRPSRELDDLIAAWARG